MGADFRLIDFTEELLTSDFDFFHFGKLKRHIRSLFMNLFRLLQLSQLRQSPVFSNFYCLF